MAKLRDVSMDGIRLRAVEADKLRSRLPGLKQYRDKPGEVLTSH